eukprot:713475-Pyramimonas_sp.AAC.1
MFNTPAGFRARRRSLVRAPWRPGRHLEVPSLAEFGPTFGFHGRHACPCMPQLDRRIRICSSSVFRAWRFRRKADIPLP